MDPLTTPPSDPYETPGEERPAQPPRYGEPPPPGQAQQPYPGQAQPGYAAGQYGEPSGYSAYGQPPAKPEPPSSILTAVKLMYAGAALSLLWALLQPTRRDTYRDAMDNPDTNITADDLDAATNLAVGMGVVVGLVVVGLWVLMARTNRGGRSWARVFATVLGVIAIPVGLLTMLQSPIDLVMGLALVALSIWILVLLYRRESTEYYNAVSRQPRY